MHRVVNKVLLVAVAALIVAGAEPVLAGGTPDSPGPHSKSQASQPRKHSAPRASKPRVYGAPIQPPIMKKRAGKRTHAQTVASSPDTAAKRKAAARNAKADLQYRREHPASADGPH